MKRVALSVAVALMPPFAFTLGATPLEVVGRNSAKELFAEGKSAVEGLSHSGNAAKKWTISDSASTTS